MIALSTLNNIFVNDATTISGYEVEENGVLVVPLDSTSTMTSGWRESTEGRHLLNCASWSQMTRA